MTFKHLAPGLVLLAAVVLVGCGGAAKGPEKQATVPATGILTHKGKPVPNASVIFQSLDGKVSSYGSTDAAGTFTLSTYGNQDGIPPGKYKVIVGAGVLQEVEPGVLPDEPKGGFKSPVPSKYGNPATTTIVLDVKEQGKNEFVIDLK
jgi:hypothetical protein